MKYKTINGFSSYKVSKEGEVYSTISNRVLKLSKQASGYLTICLKGDNGKKKVLSVHRIVAMAWLKKPKTRNYVNHKDGNRSNNHVDNLEWVNQSENIIHSYREGSVRKSHKRVIEMTNEEAKNEKWTYMYGYKGIYEISNMGRIRSISRVYYVRGVQKYHFGKMKVPSKRNGYYTVHLTDYNGKAKRHSVHRMVLLSFTRNPEKKLEKGLIVNHKDGDKTNNKLSNLEWCTHSENTQHYHDKLKKR